MLRLIPLLLILGAALPLRAAEMPTVPAATAAQADAAQADPAAKKERRKTDCNQTGSRIKGGNRSQPMRCYSRDDLAKTGAIDVGDALRRLDPSLR